jgi:hypothetical protein
MKIYGAVGSVSDSTKRKRHVTNYEKLDKPDARLEIHARKSLPIFAQTTDISASSPRNAIKLLREH